LNEATVDQKNAQFTKVPNKKKSISITDKVSISRNKTETSNSFSSVHAVQLQQLSIVMQQRGSIVCSSREPEYEKQPVALFVS
jgi:hypothetical protein